VVGMTRRADWAHGVRGCSLGHTVVLLITPGTVLRHRVADTSHVHGRGVLAQRPELRSDPLLRHRTVLLLLPVLAPVWPRRAAARRDGWSTLSVALVIGSAVFISVPGGFRPYRSSSKPS